MSLRPSLALAGVVTAIGGVALIGILPKFGVAQPIPVGVAVIGCGLALLGLDGIITGVVTEGQGRVGRITYYGLGARLRGTMTFLLGGIIAVGSVLDLLMPGGIAPLLDTTAGRGLAMLGIGVFAMLFGGIFLLNDAPVVQSPALAFVLALPGRIFGAILLLLGMTLIAAGIVAFAAPATAELLVDRLLRSFGVAR
jgi:hypothetical protein